MSEELELEEIIDLSEDEDLILPEEAYEPIEDIADEEIDLQPETIDLSEYGVNTKDQNLKTNMAIIGLGATGSSFMIPLSHFLKYRGNISVTLFDYDHLERQNDLVSLYGFYGQFGINVRNSSKAVTSLRFLTRMLDRVTDQNNLELNYNHVKVDMKILEEHYSDKELDFIFVFTDNNESRYEVAKYHEKYPETKVFDLRIGTYDQFEIYFSMNPKKYMKTIYFDEDKKPLHIETNKVCLDDRMSFSIALTGATLLMNVFTKFYRNDLPDTDFKHIMYGNNFIGEVKGY